MTLQKLGNAYGLKVRDPVLQATLVGRVIALRSRWYSGGGGGENNGNLIENGENGGNGENLIGNNGVGNRSQSKDKEFFLTYFFRKEKSYVVIHAGQIYYLLGGIGGIGGIGGGREEVYEVRSSLATDIEVILEGDIAANHFILSDFHLPGVGGSTLNFVQRLKRMNEFIDVKYRYDPVLDPYYIQVAEFVTPNYCQSFIHDFHPPYKNAQTGWLMVKGYTNIDPEWVYLPFGTPFYFNAEKIDRLSPVVHPACTTACFKLLPTELADIYQLFLYSASGTLLYYDIACVPSKITSAFLSKHIINTAVFTCHFHPRFKKWQPLHVAPQQHPDSITRLLGHGI